MRVGLEEVVELGCQLLGSYGTLACSGGQKTALFVAGAVVIGVPDIPDCILVVRCCSNQDCSVSFLDGVKLPSISVSFDLYSSYRLHPSGTAHTAALGGADTMTHIGRGTVP